MTPLERGYRALLVLFPPPYRERRGEELVGTLLDAAPAGRRVPRPAEVGDLLRAAAVAWGNALSAHASRATIRRGLALAAAVSAVLPCVLGFFMVLPAAAVLRALTLGKGGRAAVLASFHALLVLPIAAVVLPYGPAGAVVFGTLAAIGVLAPVVAPGARPPGRYAEWLVAAFAVAAMGRLVLVTPLVLLLLVLPAAAIAARRDPVRAVALAALAPVVVVAALALAPRDPVVVGVAAATGVLAWLAACYGVARSSA